MLKRAINICIVALLLFAFTAIAGAEKAEWKDSSYNFSKMGKVYVESEVVFDVDEDISNLEEMKIRQAVEDNKNSAKNIQFTNSKELADAIVEIAITDWGQHKYWHEPETVLEYKTITKTDKNGKVSSTQIPVPVYKPGYYTYTQYFSAKYIVTDKDGKTVYERVDSREDAKESYAMFGRATKDFYKSFDKLAKK